MALEPIVNGASTASSPTLLSMLNVLVDAAISNLHAHNGADLDEVARRVAARCGRDTAGVAAVMVDPSAAALGIRRLLWPLRSLVQWNPADDQLVRVNLESRTSDTWSVSGRLRAIAPDEDERLLTRS